MKLHTKVEEHLVSLVISIEQNLGEMKIKSRKLRGFTCIVTSRSAVNKNKDNYKLTYWSDN